MKPRTPPTDRQELLAICRKRLNEHPDYRKIIEQIQLLQELEAQGNRDNML